MAKGPKDINQMGFDLVAKVTGTPTLAEIDRGRKGGEVRANNLTSEEKSEIAKKAAEARWSKKIKAEPT